VFESIKVINTKLSTYRFVLVFELVDFNLY